MLIGDENGRRLERTLPQHGARRGGHSASLGHGQIRAPGEHVECICIYETAIVVAHVDDHARAGVVFRIQVHEQPLERSRGHVDHMHIAELAPAGARDVVAIVVHPLPVEQPLLGSLVDRLYRHLAFLRLDRQRYAAPDLVLEQLVQIGMRRDRDAIDRSEVITGLDLA